MVNIANSVSSVIMIIRNIEIQSNVNIYANDLVVRIVKVDLFANTIEEDLNAKNVMEDLFVSIIE
jgi:hypothetical protein